MPYNLSAQCPCCNKIAVDDMNEIEEKFGFRVMDDGRKIPQSYCRVCRSSKCEAGNPKHPTT